MPYDCAQDSGATARGRLMSSSTRPVQPLRQRPRDRRADAQSRAGLPVRHRGGPWCPRLVVRGDRRAPRARPCNPPLRDVRRPPRPAPAASPCPCSTASSRSRPGGRGGKRGQDGRHRPQRVGETQSGFLSKITTAVVISVAALCGRLRGVQHCVIRAGRKSYRRTSPVPWRVAEVARLLAVRMVHPDRRGPGVATGVASNRPWFFSF